MSVLRTRTGFHSALLLVLITLPACVGSSSRDIAKDKERLKAYILDQAPAGITKLDIDFDGKVKLVGYKLEPQGVVRPGQSLKLVMYWRSVKKLDSGWSLFTHVLDGAGERILNIDNVGPLREVKTNRQSLPPSYWDPGKVYVDEQTFAVPTTLRTEKMQIVSGVWKGDERLKIIAGPHDTAQRGIVATLRTSVNSLPRNTRIPSLRAPKLEDASRLKIDGKLDEQEWTRAALTSRFVNVRTGEANQDFPVNGSVKVMWSAEGAYFGFEVTDPNIVGGFNKDEVDPHLWTRDTVEIMLDPDGDGDNKNYYEIQINPQGLVFDSQFDEYNKPKTEPNGPFGHQDWSSNVQAKVTIDGTLDKPDDRDRGYTIEAFIPWKSFSKAAKIPPEPGSSWRVNFYAMENNGGVAWSPILNQGNFHKASRFGRITWFEPAAAKPVATSQAKKDGNATAAPSASASPPAARAPEGVVRRATNPVFQSAPHKSSVPPTRP